MCTSTHVSLEEKQQFRKLCMLLNKMAGNKSSEDFNIIRENMKRNDKFIGDILTPIEQALGMKFNKFDKNEDPKFVEPKKKGSLKRKLEQAERRQNKIRKLGPEDSKKLHWQSALEKAHGLKVKDDPKLIRKTIKRKESDKRRHRKKWAERTEKLDHSKKIQEKKKKDRIMKAKSRRKGGCTKK